MINIISSKNNIIKNIIHISDLHFTIKDRYLEYSDVFDKFLELIKQYEKETTIVVITGDIFNEKNKLESKLVSFVKEYIYKISNLHTTFMITGNHDLLSSNRNIPDSITSVFYKDNQEDYMYDYVNNLYYLKNTGYYIYNNIGFGVLSIFDILDNTSSGLKNGVSFPDGSILDEYFLNIGINYTKVALLHTTVKDSLIQTNDGHSRYLESYENHLSVDDIKNYDYIMLGDVHKFQYINNACYPSSLVQQNFGEDVLDHGFVNYNINTNSREFTRIISKYALVKCHIKIIKKKVHVNLPQYNNETKNSYPSHLMVRLHISEEILSQYINSKNTKDDLLNEVNEWFKNNNFIIRNLEVIFDKSENTIINSNVKFELDKSIDWTDISTIKKYIKETCPDEYNNVIDELQNIYEVSILEKSNSHNVHWRLKILEWDNMFCYGENNKIDFTKNNLNIIIGNNYSGKSSIIDILIFCLFGTTLRIDKIVQVININKKSAFCSLIFEYGQDVYKLERYLKKKSTKSGESHGQKIYLKRIKDNAYENIIINSNAWTGEKLIETPLKIDEYTNKVFGNKYNFLSTYILNQNNQNSFVHMKNTERKELLESWLNLECLEEMRKLIKNNKKILDDEYIKLNSAIHQLEQVKNSIGYEDCDIEILQNQIKEIENNIASFQSILKIEKPVTIFIEFNNKKFSDVTAELEIDNYKNKIEIIKSLLSEDIQYDEEKLIENNNKIFILKSKIEENNKNILKLENIKKPNIKKYDFKSYDYYLNRIDYLKSNIDDKVIEYFNNNENQIPIDRQRQNYLIWLENYTNFKNQISKLDFFIDIDNNNNIDLKLKEFKTSFDIDKENYMKKQKLQIELSNFNISNNISDDQIEIEIKNNKLQQEEYWNYILKNKLKSMQVDKNDHTFYIQYYEYLDVKIDKLKVKIFEEDTCYDNTKYKLDDIIHLKNELQNYKQIKNEYISAELSYKKINKFKFDSNCDCCSSNSKLLKYDDIYNKYTLLKNNIENYNNKYKSISDFEDNIVILEKYKKWLKDKQEIENEIKNMENEKSLYNNIKVKFNEYKKLQIEYNNLINLQKYYKLKNEYDNLYSSYSLEKEKELSFIVSNCNKIKDFNKEKLEWNKYLGKYDEYEIYKEKYEYQTNIKKQLNDIYVEYSDFIKHKEYMENIEKINNLKNEKVILETELQNINMIKTQLEIQKKKYLQSQQNKQELFKIYADLELLTTKLHEYKSKMKIYNSDLQKYNEFNIWYENELLKNKNNNKLLLQHKVKLETYFLKSTQYNNISNDINIKKASLNKIYNKINIYKLLNDIMSLNGYNNWIYKNVIPLLNDYVNDILSNIVDFSCEIKLENESNKTAINILIKNSNSEHFIPIKMASGFQNQILNIAFRLCLIRLNNSVGNVVFMDESFVSFDLNFQSKIPELLKYFNNYIDNIYIISHHNDLDKFIKGKYIVEKKGLYSYIKNI